MTLEDNLRLMELSREDYWLRHPSTSPYKLRWRAITVRHSFHVLPGESILEIGAGSGLWTEYLSSVLRGENPITAAVFNDEYLESHREIPNATFVKVNNFAQDLPAEGFDYIVGTAIICHDQYPQNLAALIKLLKPGGHLLFFEPNNWNPQVFLKQLTRWKMPPCQVGMREFELMKIASHQGFTNIEIIPYDLIHACTPKSLVPFLQSLAFILEHMPVVRHLCGTLYIWGKKPGDEAARRPSMSLANHTQLFGSVSVVTPCYNEAMNIPTLTDTLIRFYGDYLHEIIIVDDNSKDNTVEVTRALAELDPRIKLVKREPPGGVGRALRDGYAAATGRYILTMDADFAQLVPELRDMFDAIAEGYDGAIGSRFSYDSVLMNYPFFKVICNRGFHLLLNLLLGLRVRDLTNNLKLYKAEILKTLEVEQPHFAANVETGLKPILAGYKIKEVPVSWINRTIEMGSSSFRILRVAPNYFLELLSICWRARSFAKTRTKLSAEEYELVTKD